MAERLGFLVWCGVCGFSRASIRVIFRGFSEFGVINLPSVVFWSLLMRYYAMVVSVGVGLSLEVLRGIFSSCLCWLALPCN